MAISAHTQCNRSSSQSTSSSVDSHASRPVERQPFMADVSAWLGETVGSGEKCSESSVSFSRDDASWRTPIRSGLARCREIWRVLATQYPEPQSRLRQLVLRIYAGECSFLPTVTARDWRSHGRMDHPRLVRPNGLPLNETLGCRLSPELCEWMMGFPVGYTDVSESLRVETPLFQTLPSGSAAASSKRKRR